MKRLIACIVPICWSVSILPPILATEEPVTITVYQDREQSYSVIPSGKDLLFCGEDLSLLTGYDYQNDGKKAVFTRGMKTVKVDLSKSVLYPMASTTNIRGIKLGEKIRRVEEKYYFPGSQLLPWLNVTCFERDGVFFVAADAVSIWDFAEGFDPAQFEFNLHTSCDTLGVSSKWLKASAYIRNNGLGMVLDAVPISLDHTYGSYKDYFDILDEMFQNKESSPYAVKELAMKSGKIKSGFDMIEWLEEMDNLPDELRALAAFNDALSTVSVATEYALYYYTFQQDNNEKLAIVDAIAGNRNTHDYPDAMVHACFDIGDSYRDLWTGIKPRLIQELTGEGVVLYEGNRKKRY